ncbi:uncharacterized protein LOC135099212 isoform X2 [Scylla paramamosain]|uniref:uncharacterized protein LOC135099212 isoform X2 n=1 Tax=Scylla paramamosain TaxID=85552 RepID=UPI003082F5F5
MKDFHTKFTRRRTLRAISERQRVTLDVIQRWEVQHIEIQDTTPVTGVLYLDGMTSPVIDIADPAQVREQLLDMTEQKCHVYLGGIQTMHYRTFEDKIGLPGMLGTVVGDVKPFCGSRKIGLPGMLGTVVGDMKHFCGRKAFRLLRNEPRIFRETASNSMLNAKTYTYVL